MLSKILAVLVFALSAIAGAVNWLCLVLQIFCWMCTFLPVVIVHFVFWVCRKEMQDPGEDSFLRRTLGDNMYTIGELWSELKNKWFRVLDSLGRK